jgi:predicted DNA-binding protein
MVMALAASYGAVKTIPIRLPEEEKQTVEEYGLLAGRIQTGLLREFIGLLESLPKRAGLVSH